MQNVMPWLGKFYSVHRGGNLCDAALSVKVRQWHQAWRCMGMYLKVMFGAILAVRGIGGLIYAAVLFVGSNNQGREVKYLLSYGILGLIFFISGLGLIKKTRDEG